MNKEYDFKKAKRLIASAKNLRAASLGMFEDWYWTADCVWENGNYKKEFPCEIGGIVASFWATPTLKLTYKNGLEKTLPCWREEGTLGDKLAPRPKKKKARRKK